MNSLRSSPVNQRTVDDLNWNTSKSVLRHFGGNTCANFTRICRDLLEQAVWNVVGAFVSVLNCARALRCVNRYFALQSTGSRRMRHQTFPGKIPVATFRKTTTHFRPRIYGVWQTASTEIPRLTPPCDFFKPKNCILRDLARHGDYLRYYLKDSVILDGCVRLWRARHRRLLHT